MSYGITVYHNVDAFDLQDSKHASMEAEERKQSLKKRTDK